MLHMLSKTSTEAKYKEYVYTYFLLWGALKGYRQSPENDKDKLLPKS